MSTFIYLLPLQRFIRQTALYHMFDIIKLKKKHQHDVNRTDSSYLLDGSEVNMIMQMRVKDARGGERSRNYTRERDDCLVAARPITSQDYSKTDSQETGDCHYLPHISAPSYYILHRRAPQLSTAKYVAHIVCVWRGGAAMCVCMHGGGGYGTY